MAEEAARAARALCCAGLPGLDALAMRLSFGGPCPIAAGCAIADRGALPEALDVAAPLLLLPFVAPMPAELRWDGGWMRAGSGGIAAGGAVLAPRATVVVAPGAAGGAAGCAVRATGSDWAMRRLGALAARTRAPATEASRRGAG